MVLARGLMTTGVSYFISLSCLRMRHAPKRNDAVPAQRTGSARCAIQCPHQPENACGVVRSRLEYDRLPRWQDQRKGNPGREILVHRHPRPRA